MGTVNVTLGDGKKLNLILGQQLENAVTEVVFDFSAWATEFGSGTVGLSVQRHKDKMPYAVVPTVSGTNATWNITETDTGKNGTGEVQVTYTVGDVVKKSAVYKFTVYRSLGEDGEYPVPGQSWMEEVEADIADIKEDLAELEGGGVPTTVRQALKTLLESAAYADTGLTDEMAIISSWASAVTAITLNQSSISISGATTSQLVATTTPTGGTVTWSSSNTAVATVSSSGLVTGVSNGTATITATSGNVSATCSVTVSGIATLSSISASYTQTGTIYDTDDLDDILTAGSLVVTATYSDSSTATVASTDYTLSGTLTEGTSVITVSYGGKTTTFNVTVTSSSVTNPYVSDNMTLWLDGIYNKSTGHDASATSWENLITGDLYANTGVTIGTDKMVFSGESGTGFTGAKPSNPSTLEIVMSVSYPSTTQAVIGGYNNGAGNLNIKNGALLEKRGNYSSKPNAQNIVSGVHTYTFVDDVGVYCDGVSASTPSVNISMADSGTTISIGGAYGNLGGYPFTGEIKCIRFYSDELTAEEIASNFSVDATRFGIS